MKQQAIQYVALDVHQATLVVSVRDEQGSIVMRATVATEARAIVGLVRGLGSRVHIVFEEGTQAQWLHDVLKPHAERVIVCNIRGRAETGNKSDRIDADRLSELLRLGSLKAVYHGASSLLTLKKSTSPRPCTRSFCAPQWHERDPDSRRSLRVAVNPRPEPHFRYMVGAEGESRSPPGVRMCRLLRRQLKGACDEVASRSLGGVHGQIRAAEQGVEVIVARS
jgi:hypothetical protein